MMYSRDLVTPFELADNQRYVNAVLLSLSGESMAINDYVANMKHIYKHVHAKADSNI